MSGIAMSTIDASTVASSVANVVFDSATHLYPSRSTGNLCSLPDYNVDLVTNRLELAVPATELRLVLGQLIRRLRSEYSFPIAQTSVLSRLDRDGPQTTSALASAERVRPQSMAQTISELESDGLVARRPDPGDKRQILIEITPGGCDKLTELRDAREGWLAGAIDSELNAREQRLLLEVIPLLRRLADR
jgi:DNA-binding MarR family transcriptional regulator